MYSKTFLDLTEALVSGETLSEKDYQDLVGLPDDDVFDLLCCADRLRRAQFGNEIQFCTICNGKSGRCSEDCSFCAQSAFSRTDAPVYGLLPREKMVEAGRRAEASPVSRFSIVTSGRRLPRNEVKIVAEALGELDRSKVSICASLGSLGREELERLRSCGVTRYHHNLETAESFFPRICTTHSYRERIQTIEEAKSLGFTVCVGGIFGLGETDQQVLELALTLKKLDVDAVPLNFLAPIAGTPLEHAKHLTPLRCLKIIAIFAVSSPKRTSSSVEAGNTT